MYTTLQKNVLAQTFRTEIQIQRTNTLDVINQTLPQFKRALTTILAQQYQDAFIYVIK